MKIELHIDPSLSGTEVTVRAPARTPEVDALLDRLAGGTTPLLGFCPNGTAVPLDLDAVLRFYGEDKDVRAIRKGVGLPEEPERPVWQRALPYGLLAAGVELLLPWLLRLVDARDVPVLTGIFYPFLILPLFCFFSGVSLAKRCRRLWLVYPVLCGVLTLPCVFLLYNSSALFQVWVAAIAALAGGAIGALREKSRK